jgi:aspartyl-tRNA(Asn)/glutamyl-tRNA(Gln) amidotransferase subunit C
MKNVELSHDTVRAIAELARLELADEEITLYAEQLSQILAYFEHLQAVDTSHVEPIASVLPLKSVLRKDAAGEPLPTGEVLANATDTESDQFRVSAILDD